MQLRVARLCLDCDEVHDAQTCPVCGSESFAFITRWIPAPERRARPRPEPPSETTDAYRALLTPGERPSGGARWLRRGVVGVAALSVAGWMWRRNAGERGVESEASRGEDNKRNARSQADASKPGVSSRG